MDANELDALPKELVRQLSAAAIRDAAVIWRGQRNRYRTELAAARKRIIRLESELIDARNHCRKMKDKSP